MVVSGLKVSTQWTATHHQTVTLYYHMCNLLLPQVHFRTPAKICFHYWLLCLSCFSTYWLIAQSIKCQKWMKNAHHKHKVTSLNSWFCSNNIKNPNVFRLKCYRKVCCWLMTTYCFNFQLWLQTVDNWRAALPFTQVQCFMKHCMDSMSVMFM